MEETKKLKNPIWDYYNELFLKNYDELLKCNDYSLMQKYIKIAKNEGLKSFMQQFDEYREDELTSDRELAAFGKIIYDRCGDITLNHHAYNFLVIPSMDDLNEYQDEIIKRCEENYENEKKYTALVKEISKNLEFQGFQECVLDEELIYYSDTALGKAIYEIFKEKGKIVLAK